jgi:hypothetical protein
MNGLMIIPPISFLTYFSAFDTVRDRLLLTLTGRLFCKLVCKLSDPFIAVVPVE